MRVSIFGSCTTRDVFRMFGDVGDVVSYHSRSSLISAMAPAVDVDLSAARWPSGFARKSVTADVRKTFFFDLSAAAPDALVIDLMSERFDLLRGRETFATRSWELLQAGVLLTAFRRVAREADALHDAWRRSAADFARALRPFPHVSVILHEAYWTPVYRDGNEVLRFPRTWRRAIAARNEMLVSYHAHIRDLFPEVVTVRPEREYVADARHRWGLGSSHYENSYYAEVAEQLRTALSRPTVAAA